MRLRRMELVIISVTVAFACFIGGYFVGRSTSAVSIVPSADSKGEQVMLVSPPALPIAPPDVRTSESTIIPVPTEEAQPSSVVPEPLMTPLEMTPELNSALPAVRDGAGRININLASRSELMDLPGIGSSLSERIVDYRNANGPFRNIEELRNVSGIGVKRFEAIMNKITV